MNTAVKLSVFGLSLTVVFGGAWAVGSAVGPGGTDAPANDPAHRVHTTGPTPAPVPPRARPVHRPGAHHGPPQGHPGRGHHR